jgi:hypothetical protein
MTGKRNVSAELRLLRLFGTQTRYEEWLKEGEDHQWDNNLNWIRR